MNPAPSFCRVHKSHYPAGETCPLCLASPAVVFDKETVGISHGHYFKNASHLDIIDVYRVIELFDVRHSALQHALKKILCAGRRGAKNDAKDVAEAIASLDRWQAMRAEDMREVQA